MYAHNRNRRQQVRSFKPLRVCRSPAEWEHRRIARILVWHRNHNVAHIDSSTARGHHQEMCVAKKRTDAIRIGCRVWPRMIHKLTQRRVSSAFIWQVSTAVNDSRKIPMRYIELPRMRSSIWAKPTHDCAEADRRDNSHLECVSLCLLDYINCITRSHYPLQDPLAYTCILNVHNWFWLLHKHAPFDKWYVVTQWKCRP